MSMPSPQLLIDQPDDGLCETQGWCEATVTEAEARQQLAEFCCDENGDTCAPTGPAYRVFMRLTNPSADYEEQRWVRCSAGAKTAVEFWEIVVA